ncbi:hypothetical protein ACWC5C_12980 [Streptomyces sp. NPDC001700]
MTSAAIELRHFRDVEPVWDTLISVYAEVRADRLHERSTGCTRHGDTRTSGRVSRRIRRY